MELRLGICDHGYSFFTTFLSNKTNSAFVLLVSVTTIFLDDCNGTFPVRLHGFVS